MANIADRFSSAFRDYAVAGLPASGPHEPIKRDVRAIGMAIDGALASLLAAFVADDATVIYAARSSLFANLAPGPGAIGIVYNDGPRNGVYIKVGASGGGSWALTGLMLQGQKGEDGRSFYESALATGYVPAGTSEKQFVEQVAGALTSQATELARQYRDQASDFADASDASAKVAASQIDLVAGIRNTLFSVRGNWAPSTAYTARDIVTNNGIAYFAVSDHTSGSTFNADLAAGRWAIYQAVPDGDLVVNSQTSRPKVPARVDAGVTNEVTLQGAVDQLAAYDGGVVRVAEGALTVSNPLRLTSRIQLRGAGRDATVLRMADGVNKNIIEIEGTRSSPVTGWSVSDLTIDGNSANNSNGSGGGGLVDLATVDLYWTGIRLKWADRGQVERVYIHHCAANGIQAEDSSYNRFSRIESSFNGFNGMFFVNQSRHNVVTSSHFEGSYDIGISCEIVPYEGQPNRSVPADGGGADDNAVIGCTFIGNGGPLGYSPRQATADYGVGALHSHRMVIANNIILDTLGWGIYLGGDTGGHVVVGNTVRGSRDNDLQFDGMVATAIGNHYATSRGQGNRIACDQPGTGALSVQNLSSEGYSSVDLYDDLSQAVLSLAYGNSDATSNALLPRINARDSLGWTINEQLVALLRPGLLTLGGRLGIGTDAPKSPLHVTGLPVYADNAAAKAAGLTAGAFYFPASPPFPGAIAAVF